MNNYTLIILLENNDKNEHFLKDYKIKAYDFEQALKTAKNIFEINEIIDYPTMNDYRVLFSLEGKGFKEWVHKTYYIEASSFEQAVQIIENISVY